MLEYDRIYVSEGTDYNKTTGLSKRIIFHYWYFLQINFRFKPKVFDGYYDLMPKARGFNDIAIVFVKGNDYRIQFLYMSKDEVINLSKNADLAEKSGTL